MDILYLSMVQNLAEHFKILTMVHIPRYKNWMIDALAKFASSSAYPFMLILVSWSTHLSLRQWSLVSKLMKGFVRCLHPHTLSKAPYSRINRKLVRSKPIWILISMPRVGWSRKSHNWATQWHMRNPYGWSDHAPQNNDTWLILANYEARFRLVHTSLWHLPKLATLV